MLKIIFTFDNFLTFTIFGCALVVLFFHNIHSNSAVTYLFICFCDTLQSELTKQQNMFKIELKLLEDELLTRLSAAESNFLGDNMLVEKLETTKHTAAEIEMKVTG